MGSFAYKLIRLLITFVLKTVIVFIFAFTSLAMAEVPEEESILVVGDSLSAGYGFSADKSWVSLLKERLKSLGYTQVVVNKSVSGATSQQGVDRLPSWLEETHPTYVILALGSNDGLRGQPILSLKKNLEKMMTEIQQAGAKVILVGFNIPPNYGPEYTEAFQNVFSALAEQHEVPFVPFLLKGIEKEKAYFQADGLHPIEEAQSILLENIWAVLQPVLKVNPN